MADRRRKRTLRSQPGTIATVSKGDAARQPSRFLTIVSRNRTALFVAIAVSWTFFLYRHALAGQFLYDDIPQIRNNPALLSWASTFHYFGAAVSFSSGYLVEGGSFYRPLFWVSLAIDRRMWGLNPLPFHVTNLVLHCANGLLWFCLLRRLRHSRWWAAAITIAWLSLPINSEAVAWISARQILLCTLGMLGSVLAIDWYLASKKSVALAVLFFLELMAMLSYEAGVLVVPATLLWAWFQTKKPQRAWLAPGLVGTGATAIVFALRHLAHARLANGSFAVLRVGLSFFRYLRWMALPIHMSVERSTDLPANNYSLAAVMAIAGLLLLIGSMLYWRDKLAPLSFGALWLVLLLVPFCGLLPNYQGLAERYEYLSSMGLVIAAGALVRNASRAARPFAIVIATAWFLWGSWRVDARSLDWKDELTIDRASLAASPNSAVLLYNIAIAETAAGDVPGAIADYGRAITANSRYEPAFVNLANLLRQQGDLQEALGVLRRAIALNANDSDAWTAIGNVYQQMRSFDEARDAYAKAVALNPADARAVANLGAALEQSGDLDGAKRQYKHAISLDPGQGSAYCNLSMVLFQQGKMDDAIGILKQAIARDDRYTPAYFDLGVLYEQADNRAAAVEMYKKVLALDRAYPKARDRLNSLLR